MCAARFSLEHFYFGQPVQADKPASRSGVLAASPGITREIAEAAVNHVTLPVGQQPVLALVRGTRLLPYLLVQTVRGGARQLMAHYILIPPDTLRSLGGQLRAFLSLVEDPLPTFAAAGTTLPLLEIDAPEVDSDDQQVDDMLELMDFTGNDLTVLETLLAGIVRTTPVIVQGVPGSVDLAQRLQYISGLLALLPPSVRFAVTFATHAPTAASLDVQFRFAVDEGTPTGTTVIYQQPTRKLTAPALDDDYSRFIVGQLRLDSSLVLARTRELTATAGWRMRQGDRLSDALAYASYRIKLDTGLHNNQPVNKDEVGKVLRDDPTLDEGLRLLYGRHLLTFSLAMDDVQYAEPLVQVLGSTPELERAAFEQMTAAQENRQSVTVFKMVARWLGGTSLSNPEAWIALAHRAAMTRLDELVKSRSLDGLNNLIRELLDAAPAVHLERIAGTILEKLLPFTPQDAALAEDAFLLAAAYMDTPRFRRLLEVKPFTTNLNPQVMQPFAYFAGSETRTPPAGLLANAAYQFGDQWAPLVLVRFAELARQQKRFDLLDEAALRGVAQLAASPAAPAHDARLLLISERPQDSELNLLGAKAARYLLQIRLALADYPDLAGQMIQQSATLYPGDRQPEYLKMVEQMFADSPISAPHAADALAHLTRHGIKSAPLLMASIGALQNRPADQHDHLKPVATTIEQTLADDPKLLNVIPADSILKVLQFHLDHHDLERVETIAGLVALSAGYADDGMRIIAQMYRLMASNRETRESALQILRVFVEQADDKVARQAIAYFGRELSLNIRNALEAVYMVRQITGGRDLQAYAASVAKIVALFQDAVTAYNERNLPTIDELTMKLSGMRDNFLREERLVFTRALLAVMKSIVSLEQQRQATRSPDPDRLLNGSVDPASGLDVLRVLAGFFSGGKRADLRLRASLPDPIGTRTRKFLRDEIVAGSEVLTGLLRAVPTDAPLQVTAANLRAAVESLSFNLDEGTRRDVTRALAVDLQKLVALIELIGEKGDPKTLDETGLGKRIDDGRHRPRSALEFLRFVYGYHLTRG